MSQEDRVLFPRREGEDRGVFKTRVEKIRKEAKSVPCKHLCLIDMQGNEKFKECRS